jgi:osmotically-inducible protein OsmY
MGKQRPGWLLLGVLLGVAGCSHQDADRLARAARRSADKLEGMTGGAGHRLSDGWQALRVGWDGLALDSRVNTRLQWDRALAGTHIEVRANGTTVELEGTVSDANQRGRAVELAESTLGVEHVTDKLTIAGEQP